MEEINNKIKRDFLNDEIKTENKNNNIINPNQNLIFEKNPFKNIEKSNENQKNEINNNNFISNNNKLSHDKENIIINLERRKSDPENYEIEREFSIEIIDGINSIEEKSDKNLINFKKNDEIEISIADEYLKCNKEYEDNNDDLISARFTTKNNNDKYLIVENINDKNENNNISDNEYESDNEEKNEDLFPFRIIGDSTKKSKKLGVYNDRYLEIDSIKGLFKRYKSSKDYPKRPNKVIDIRNFILLRKLIRTKNYYDLGIAYNITKKGKIVEKSENYRFKNCICRNKWFDSLLLLWKYLKKGKPEPIFTSKILLFIDDKIGILQEIKENKKKKRISSKVTLKNFKILNLLGIGGFGTVFKVKHILTDKIYAMKVMNKNYIIRKKYLHYIISEFEIMKTLSGFPFVLDLHYCFQSANYLYLITDYCPYGDFTKLICMNMKLFFAELVLAIEHIHKHNIIYRDLKPENILLDTTGHIRLCDFNLAKSGVPKGKRAKSFCGSPIYLSPEMLGDKGVDYRCDIYGIGLLMYEFTTGRPAYYAKDIKSLYELIKINHINFNNLGLHDNIKDLVEKILIKEPEKRISIEEIKKHPYFKDIDFDKVLKKQYGPIITQKKEILLLENYEDENLSQEEREKKELIKFRLQQQKLDAKKDYTYLDGKITVKEMNRDLRRVMKNTVRNFYFIKKEDSEQSKDFELNIKGNIDISNLINNK